MEIIYNKIPRMELEEFADNFNLKLEIHERNMFGEYPKNYERYTGHPYYRFYACFESVYVKDGYIISSCYGDGETPHEAVKDYCYKLSGQQLKIKNEYLSAPILICEQTLKKLPDERLK